jgi:hypothetical protein
MSEIRSSSVAARDSSMNASLVAYYGTTPKPGELEELIKHIQNILAGDSRLKFQPYNSKQVHATLVGLEGLRINKQIISTNFAELRGSVKLIDLKAVVQYLRSTQHLPFSVRLGGFDSARNYSFSSRGLHPGIRSFSIQGHIVVAMGWPVLDETFPPSLDLLRRELAGFGALHKYHASEGEVDNDFFFVLGQIERRERDRVAVLNVQDAIRRYLAETKAIDFVVDIAALSFVAYEETTLPIGRTRQFSLDEITANPQVLINLYDAAV